MMTDTPLPDLEFNALDNSLHFKDDDLSNALKTIPTSTRRKSALSGFSVPSVQCTIEDLTHLAIPIEPS